MSEKLLLILITVSLIAVNNLAFAQSSSPPKVVVSQGRLQSLSIALTDMNTVSTDDKDIADKIIAVTGNDLKNSGLIDVVNKNSHVERNLSSSSIPRFGQWRTLEIDSLLTSDLSIKDNSIILRFRLWDIYTGQQLAGREFSGDRYSWRRMAHLLADAIYQRLTGEEGYFDTRIAYIAENGPAKDRIKRLAIMDQDGANHDFLTNGDFLALTPRFSPSGKQIAYLHYFNNNPQIHIINLESGQEQVLGRFKGMTFAPRFGPDGQKLFFAFASEGNSEIFSVSLKNRTLNKLTDNPAIDISPSPSPDGNFIAFVSDRSGSPQIYIKSLKNPSSKARRLTFSNGSYSTPAWSPRQDMIAFTRQKGRTFAVGVIRVDGTGERILSESYRDEGPSWSPNGRRLIFFRSSPFNKSGERDVRLFTVDITGYDVKQVPTFGAASDPAWSPVIK